MVQLHSLGLDEWMKGNQTFASHYPIGTAFGITLEQEYIHIIHTVLSIAPLHSSVEDAWNEMQHNFFLLWHHWHWFWHHMALVLPSCDSSSVIDGNIAFLRSRWLKWDAMWYFGTCNTNETGASISTIGQQQCHQWHHHIPKVNQSDWGTTWHLLGHVTLLVPALASHEANCTTAFFRSGQLISCATWPFCHVMPLMLPLASRHTDGVIKGVISFLSPHNDQNEVKHFICSHVIPLTSASLDTNGITNGTWQWCQHWY